MILTEEILQKSFPKCKKPGEWPGALNPAMEKYEINSIPRAAAFLAQVGHESCQLNHIEENLSYSARRLMTVWPRRFPTIEKATPYARNPERLANYVYANRIGNGPEDSGDGWKFRGRGLIQLTGRSNYNAASAALGADLIADPDQLLAPPVAALSAAWFWQSHGLNALADDKTDDNDIEDFTRITKIINGGQAGLQERLALFKHITTIVSA